MRAEYPNNVPFRRITGRHEPVARFARAFSDCTLETAYTVKGFSAAFFGQVALGVSVDRTRRREDETNSPFTRPLRQG